MVSLPPSPKLDPLKLVMEKAEVPANKRVCPTCNAKVKREKGFCGACGAEYNYLPSLKTGDIVNGKFEVKGAIAFGGLGWIYLAYDNILSRWVILKGLLNAKDEASAAAAMAERQFLAAVKHPKIVGIYDFVNQGSEGYIVMEYVGGQTIESFRKALDMVTVSDDDGKPVKSNVLRKDLTDAEINMTVSVEKRGVLPVEETIAYILGILPAFSYLHNNGFVYCDFKAENFMFEENDVKLVDMGGVRRIGDPNGDIYGTRGYMAPEASEDPIAVSDLYTIGRTLAVSIMDFKFQTDFEHSLPTPDQQPVLAQNDSLYRFLLRSTHQDPDQRFQSADEMAEQLQGVLREIVSLKTEPHPYESKAFTSDNLLDPSDIQGCDGVDIRLLPSLKIDPTDVAGNDILRLAAITDPKRRVEMLKQVAAKYGAKSVEARLRLAGALMQSASYKDAERILDEIEKEDEFDWRVKWYRGRLKLAQGDGKAARIEFGKVYFEMPGELAPKLAIAFASEKAADLNEAVRYYERVAKVDPSQTTACFGLARCQMARKDISGAGSALGMIPASHSLYNRSRIKLAEILMHDEAGMNDQLIDQASQTIETISADGGIVHQLAAKLLSCVLRLIADGKTKENHARQILGRKMNMLELRCGAETEYRQAARYAADKTEHIFWVDLANAVRPRSLV
jgi:serine/threonine-protein kinase PknG